MATSGSKSVAVTSWDTLKFSWWENSQSIANNTTTIGWEMELIAGSSGRIDSSTEKSWAVTVNGTKYSGTNTVGISNNATKTLASGTTTITHNTNGTKTFSYSFSQSFSGITFSGTALGTVSGSGSGTLDTIPRTSSLTASNGTLGTAQTLTINKADSSFLHTITYTNKYGQEIGTIAVKTSNSSVSFTPPISLATENTTGTTVSTKLVLWTYTSGGTLIGTTSKTISCAIPASVKPSCSLTVTDVGALTSGFGTSLKGLSRFKVDIKATTSQGSPIASYRTVIGGKAYTTASFTTDVINSAGALTITATVTDGRGRKGTASKTITIVDYSAPSVSKLAVHRCDADGTANEQGEYVQATFSGTVTALSNKNECTYKIQYKKTAETEYTTIALNALNNVFSVSDHSYIFPADSGFSYNVRLIVDDLFAEVAKSTTVSTGYALMHWHPSGRGLGIGKLSEFENLFDVGMKTKFTGGIQNIILEKISDLNDVLIPNTYVSVNKGAASYTNCPIASGTFVLEVMSAGAEGQVFQRLTTTFKDGLQECYERHYYQSSWGAWSCVYSDTGWINLTLQSGIEHGSETGYLKGRLKNGVLYIKGDIVGVEANWKYIAQLPSALLSPILIYLPSSTRFSGVYNMSNFCGMSLSSNGQLYVSANSTGAWDRTKQIYVNATICI